MFLQWSIKCTQGAHPHEVSFLALKEEVGVDICCGMAEPQQSHTAGWRQKALAGRSKEGARGSQGRWRPHHSTNRLKATAVGTDKWPRWRFCSACMYSHLLLICYLKENHSSTDSLPNAQGHQGRARTHNSIRVSLNECQGPSHCSRRLLPPRVSMLRKLSVDRKPVSQTSCQMPPPSPSLFHHHY